VFKSGQTRYWRRPGKNIGISATTGHADDRDRLYVFTSSTAFTPEHPYTKFGAYALLEHDSDHSAAAKALAAAGYGKRAETPRPAGVTAAPETVDSEPRHRRTHHLQRDRRRQRPTPGRRPRPPSAPLSPARPLAHLGRAPLALG